jgi:hypothetical protein
MTNIIKTTDTAEIAAEIRAEHERAYGKAREALEHARRAGELLIEAKRKLAHGAWAGWLRDNVPFSERTAQGYMRLARQWDRLNAKSATVADLGLRDALTLLAEPGDAAHATAAAAAAPPVYTGGLIDNATFAVAPSPANRLSAIARDGALLLVEPHTEPAYFYVTRIAPDYSTIDCLRRAVRFDMVGATLLLLGVSAGPLVWTGEPAEPASANPWATFGNADDSHWSALVQAGLAR